MHEFDSKRPGYLNWKSIAVSTARITFENSYMERTDKTWKKEMEYLKLAPLEKSQQKPYGKNNMNNEDTNTTSTEKYTEIISYWNYYHLDEIQTTNWIFFTPLDNLSFLGGLLDIFLFIPSVLMFAYTFRLNEINVFFFHQVMKKWDHDHKGEKEEQKTIISNPHTKYS